MWWLHTNEVAERLGWSRQRAAMALRLSGYARVAAGLSVCAGRDVIDSWSSAFRGE
jgi:hypothetical protein